MSKELDIVFYKHIYDDVKHLEGNDLITHYNLHGTREYRAPNREFFNEKFKTVYNYKDYIIKFPELADKSEDDAIHFFIYNDYVEPTFYKLLYQEIRHYDEMQCRAHYYCFGLDQKRFRNLREFKEKFDYPYDLMKNLFVQIDDYEFVRYIISDYITTIEYFFKEFYLLLGNDYYRKSLKEMINEDLIFTDKFNDNKLINFNYYEYKTSYPKINFKLKIEYFIKYLIDSQ